VPYETILRFFKLQAYIFYHRK